MGMLFFVLSAEAPLTGVAGASPLAAALGNGARQAALPPRASDTGHHAAEPAQPNIEVRQAEEEHAGGRQRTVCGSPQLLLVIGLELATALLAATLVARVRQTQRA